ncbi:MAG: hypothetical protein ACT4ON_05575 [Bacteroidota bacterium]
MYKLDRTAFKAATAEEASEHASYYKKLSWKERLKILIYLNSIAFRLVNKPEPKLDRTVFNIKTRNTLINRPKDIDQ